nr:LPS assembly lipoprotein LptE [Burkholderia sp. Ac-20353]
MLVGSALALSGCGFQLRGQQNYAFKHLLVVGAPPSVAARLTRLVEGGSDTKIVTAPDQADAVLNMSEARGLSTLTLNKYGSASEYAINYTMTYTLSGTDGTLLIPPSAIALNRAMTYSDQYTNAKVQEADILYADMQNDAVDQLMRRLAIVHSLHPAPEDVVPGVGPRAPLPPPPL